MATAKKYYRKLTIGHFSSDITKAGEMREVELRPPDRGEILVKNYYAGVNAIDMNVMTGRSIFTTGTFPFDLGMEVSATLSSLLSLSRIRM